MEKGKINSKNGFSNFGTIADGQGKIINFKNDAIVSKDRNHLQAGDQVWFERIGTNTNTTAINIRLC